MRLMMRLQVILMGMVSRVLCKLMMKGMGRIVNVRMKVRVYGWQ